MVLDKTNRTIFLGSSLNLSAWPTTISIFFSRTILHYFYLKKDNHTTNELNFGARGYNGKMTWTLFQTSFN